MPILGHRYPEFPVNEHTPRIRRSWGTLTLDTQHGHRSYTLTVLAPHLGPINRALFRLFGRTLPQHTSQGKQPRPNTIRLKVDAQPGAAFEGPLNLFLESSMTLVGLDERDSPHRSIDQDGALPNVAHYREVWAEIYNTLHLFHSAASTQPQPPFSHDPLGDFGAIAEALGGKIIPLGNPENLPHATGPNGTLDPRFRP